MIFISLTYIIAFDIFLIKIACTIELYCLTAGVENYRFRALDPVLSHLEFVRYLFSILSIPVYTSSFHVVMGTGLVNEFVTF